MPNSPFLAPTTHPANGKNFTAHLLDLPVRSTSFVCCIFSRSWTATTLSKTAQCCRCSVERSLRCRFCSESTSFCCFFISFTNCFSQRRRSIVSGSKPRSSTRKSRSVKSPNGYSLSNKNDNLYSVFSTRHLLWVSTFKRRFLRLKLRLLQSGPKASRISFNLMMMYFEINTYLLT